jgi:hypothetical protein
MRRTADLLAVERISASSRPEKWFPLTLFASKPQGAMQLAAKQLPELSGIPDWLVEKRRSPQVLRE